MAQLKLDVLTPETAPSSTREILVDVKKKYGFQPNLYGVFAHSPAPIKGYLGLAEAFASSSLSPLEQNVVLLATARANDCFYCVAVHSTVGDMQKHPGDVIDAIRNDTAIADPKLEALRRFTQAIVRNRGHVEDAQVTAFIDAGYQAHQALEVLVGVSLKTLSNYTNHLTQPPLDAAFAPRAWSPKK
ncbi:MAG: carboxymuconolactone decarboxylase family protein [Myxococcaceae bacterium]